MDGSTLFIGDVGSLKIQADGRVVTEEILLQDEKLRGEWGDRVYRTRVYFGSVPQIVVTM